MLNAKNIIILFGLSFLIVFSVLFALRKRSNEVLIVPEQKNSAIAEIGKIKSTNTNGRWIRCFRAHNGTIYFKGHLKSIDDGKTVVSQNDVDVEDLNLKSGGAKLVKKGMFYAIDETMQIVGPGVYSVKGCRSTDDLKKLHSEVDTVYVPGGPTQAAQNAQGCGICPYRNIIEMPDGSWLMTMYGNFTEDTLPPQDSNAQFETKYMTRTFIVKSSDEGHTWNYLSSVAVPHSGDPIGEGFNEPSMALLNDGRLLCIMRTGHHFPLYASWSADGGQTWTPPVYTGLDRGCDPCLIRLHDGRVALSWGRRFPEGLAQADPPMWDQDSWKYPGQGYTNLAISDDGGATWVNRVVAQRSGTSYSTIFEVQPGLIFFQVDQWYWRVRLNNH